MATDEGLRRALQRYQVMAIVTGVFLLLLTTGVVLKYVVGWDDPTFLLVNTWIDIIHGWIYIVYMVMAAMLWTRVKWGLGRLALLLLAGVVPLLSFVMERRVTREVAGSLSS